MGRAARDSLSRAKAVCPSLVAAQGDHRIPLFIDHSALVVWENRCVSLMKSQAVFLLKIVFHSLTQSQSLLAVMLTLLQVDQTLYEKF